MQREQQLRSLKRNQQQLLDEKNSIEANIVKYRHAYDHSIQVELELKEAVAAAARDVEEAKIAKKNIRDVRVVFACAFNE